MSINTILDNPIILNELKNAIGGGGGSVSVLPPLEKDGNVISLFINGIKSI